MKHILVTNDDGIRAPGLQAAFEAGRTLGRAVIIAPEHDNSAASHSLTMSRPLYVRQVDESSYAINGTPTDCVTIGIGKILPKKPDLVISGINPGPNLGDDVSYSGTVSAAIEATMLGIPSIAVSLAAETEPFHYETAAAFIVRLAGIILSGGSRRTPCSTSMFPTRRWRRSAEFPLPGAVADFTRTRSRRPVIPGAGNITG